MQNKIRLSKRLADMGVCSRREAEELILQGWVRVNGEIVTILPTKVGEEDLVEVSEDAQHFLAKKMSIVLYKPVGYVSHSSEDKYPHVFDLITAKNCADEKSPKIKIEGMAPVGRLDIDSRGLMLLSQDGVLAKAVIGESTDVEKEYIVNLDTMLTKKEMSIFREGMLLDGEKLKPVKVKHLRDNLYQLTLKQGKKRQIRRMVEALGKKIYMLKRIRIGGVKLGDLEEGQWRVLTKQEKASIIGTLKT